MSLLRRQPLTLHNQLLRLRLQSMAQRPRTR
jgi:hypothetical protein